MWTAQFSTRSAPRELSSSLLAELRGFPSRGLLKVNPAGKLVKENFLEICAPYDIDAMNPSISFGSS